jgi:molybdenum cofactor synthesis domain-containing protein
VEPVTDPMRAAVVTISDRVTLGEAVDESGPAVAEMLEVLGFTVASVEVVPDGIAPVVAGLEKWVGEVPLVVTTGGTGFSSRDLTPEATQAVIEREAPGLAEAMRAAAVARTPHGMLSRGVCGIAGGTLIVNLPGSVTGATESLAVVGPALRHAVELLRAVPTEHHGAGT